MQYLNWFIIYAFTGILFEFNALFNLLNLYIKKYIYIYIYTKSTELFALYLTL